MNKKLIAVGVVTAAAGCLCKAAIDGYKEITAREKKKKSIIKRLAEMGDKTDYSDMIAFTQNKVKWNEQQETEKISITSERGDLLKGYLTLNKNESNVFVFFAHGCRTDHNGDPANFMQYYIEKGYNFLSVDHVAQGESGGAYMGYDYFESIDSLEWLDYLIRRFGQDIKIIIHGVSMGGATVCQMSDKVPSQVKLAVADCPYTSALDEFDHVAKSAGVKYTGTILKAINAMNKRFAGYDFKETDVRNAVKNAKVPMLFVHGKEDDFVPTRMGVELYEICTNEKELYLVDNAIHAQSIKTDEVGYHKKLDAFIEKYL